MSLKCKFVLFHISITNCLYRFRSFFFVFIFTKLNKPDSFLCFIVTSGIFFKIHNKANKLGLQLLTRMNKLLNKNCRKKRPILQLTVKVLLFAEKLITMTGSLRETLKNFCLLRPTHEKFCRK